MKKLSIIFLSSLLIYSCGSSPEKILEKGDKFVANSEIEKAIESYQKIIDKFPEDSLAQTAQYNIAWIELDDKNNYSEGFSRVAKDIPKPLFQLSLFNDILS